jgi:hypothetical protein
MKIDSTVKAPKGITLPYSIKVDNSKYSIGIFGDSFAALAEEMILPGTNHEQSWIFYLANLLSCNCDSYGICGGSMLDTKYTLQKCEKEYDFYIIWYTYPDRKWITKKQSDNKPIGKPEYYVKQRKVLHIFWDLSHNKYDINGSKYLCEFHLTHPNENESDAWNLRKNPLDMLGGYHHMSNRGNLLLAIELHNIIAPMLNI